MFKAQSVGPHHTTLDVTLCFVFRYLISTGDMHKVSFDAYGGGEAAYHMDYTARMALAQEGFRNERT